MSEPPEVSVVVPTWNRAELLARALRSIAAQTAVRLECLVVDDGSSAETQEAYQALWPELDDRFRLLTSERSGTGPGAARNRGIKAARGAFVAFLDDDDRWGATDHLATAVAALKRCESPGLFFANMSIESDGGLQPGLWFSTPLLTTGPVVSEEPRLHRCILKDLLEGLHARFIQIGSVVVPRALASELLFWEKTHFLEDHNFILRCLDRSRAVFYRPDPAVIFNVQPRVRAYNRVDDIERNLAQINAMQHVRTAVRRGLVRRCARGTEAWSGRVISELLMKEGRRRAAMSWAWQALCLWISPGAALWFGRQLGRSLVGRKAAGPEPEAAKAAG